ncbi:MAG TPA: DUF2863 family protein [Rhodocyclaceae bacterium]|jgi:hypothetical protein|nr:DUF2863 family protein [Rhodocyclaceae bacterium]
MKRTRSSRHARLTPRTESLIQLAEAYGRSCSRIEDAWWERELGTLIAVLLEERNEEGLNAALDKLYNDDSRAYDSLADMIEANCECLHVEGYDVQFIAAPILAWSRYNIPAGTIAAPVLETLRVQLQAHVLAADTRLALANYLFSPDHLPQGFCSTAELARELGEAALHNRTVSIDPAMLPESMAFLSDSRYLVGAVIVPQGKPLFRWQEKDRNTDGSRATAERNWQAQGGNAIAPLLAGCAFEMLLPQAYFTASRETDRASRPFSLKASVEFLKTTLDVPAHGLRAVIAPFFEDELVEYRIGFTRRDAHEVVYGLVWPLLDGEDENTETPAQISTLLKEQDIDQLTQLDHRFPVEFCDDCGSPLYPNPDGEIVHAEMPEDETEQVPKHLH